jgi:hypothetical protein
MVGFRSFEGSSLLHLYFARFCLIMNESFTLVHLFQIYSHANWNSSELALLLPLSRFRSLYCPRFSPLSFSTPCYSTSLLRPPCHDVQSTSVRYHSDRHTKASGTDCTVGPFDPFDKMSCTTAGKPLPFYTHLSSCSNLCAPFAHFFETDSIRFGSLKMSLIRLRMSLNFFEMMTMKNCLSSMMKTMSCGLNYVFCAFAWNVIWIFLSGKLILTSILKSFFPFCVCALSLAFLACAYF